MSYIYKIGEDEISLQPTTQEQHIEWLRRSAQRRQPLPEDRLARAWQTARRAAQLLRTRYGVSRVRVFGSLLYPDQFHANSDIDLAVEGLTPADYWDALADVLFLEEEMTVDLVEASSCPPSIWKTTQSKGVDI